MSDHLERDIGDELERRLADVGVGPGDLAAVTRRSVRLRRRRRTTIVVAAAAVVALVAATAVVVVGDGGRRGIDPAVPAAGTWTEVARSPLAPMHDAVAAWTGDEVVVVGGGNEPPCPPNALCTEADVYTGAAAAYDPDTDTWRTIADAPVDVGPGWLLFATADRLVLTDGAYGYGRRWFGYDVGTDRWSSLPRPPARVVASGGVLDGELYELGRDGSLVVLDPVAGTWRTVPGSTVEPALDVGTLTVTDEGVFVTGTDPTEPEVHDAPEYVYVDRFDGERWTRYPRTGQIGSFWHWTGERLVAFDPSVATGLTGLPPEGGVLDVDTGVWSPLPHAPDVESGGGFGDDNWSVDAAGGPVLLGWSSVYDDRTGTWSPQGRPGGTSVDSDQAAVWAGDRVVVVGGLDEETGYTDVSGLSNQTWVWTPAG